MRLRRVIARIFGILYLLLGVANLIGLLVPDVREQIISLGAVLFRYGGFIAVGVGLLMLRKWAAYVLAFVLVANFALVFFVYGGQTMELEGLNSLLPLIGPIFFAALFYYLWPALKPQKSESGSNDA
ncbi:MAG: hypothetical protein Hals2KO_35180 [Halioglobus sp.]